MQGDKMGYGTQNHPWRVIDKQMESKGLMAVGKLELNSYTCT